MFKEKVLKIRAVGLGFLTLGLTFAPEEENLEKFWFLIYMGLICRNSCLLLTNETFVSFMQRLQVLLYDSTAGDNLPVCTSPLRAWKGETEKKLTNLQKDGDHQYNYRRRHYVISLLKTLMRSNLVQRVTNHVMLLIIFEQVFPCCVP